MSTFKTIPITGTCPVTNSDVTVNARYRYIHPLGDPNGHINNAKLQNHFSMLISPC